jgi:hypothetical protein
MQEILTEGERRLNTIDLLIRVACFANRQAMFAISKAADSN